MYESIVVGTDGSEGAGIAVSRAIELAQACSASLHVVHAYQSTKVSHAVLAAEGGGMSVDVAGLNAEAADVSSKIAVSAVERARALGVTAEAHSGTGSPSDVLVSAAQAVGADLIVVGSRGMSGARRVLGSVPNKVAHHAPCDVLIVDTQTD
ncbi:MAG: universal stress protein [Acidimicrobiia bacterium]